MARPFLVHGQAERRIDRMDKLEAWSFYRRVVPFVGIALDPARRK